MVKEHQIIECGNEKAIGFEIVPLVVWVPPPTVKDESILILIKRQNKAISSESWTIAIGLRKNKDDGKTSGSTYIQNPFVSCFLLNASLIIGLTNFGRFCPQRTVMRSPIGKKVLPINLHHSEAASIQGVTISSSGVM